MTGEAGSPPAPAADGAVAALRPLIVAFSCNWCSYAGADLAGISRMQYPPSVRVVRLMCSGRVHPALVLRALELGADGVLVSGCHPGDCHYTFGNKSAELQVGCASRLAEAAGLGAGRVRLQWVSASEGAVFARTVGELTRHVQELGPSPLRATAAPAVECGPGGAAPIAAPPSPSGPGARMLEDAFRDTHAYRCIECGKCTGICPVNAHLPAFHPRRMVVRGLYGMEGELAGDPVHWSCLTCGLCREACRVDVDLPEFLRRLRTIARLEGRGEVATHGGLVQTFDRLCSHQSLRPDLTAWADAPGLGFDPASDTVFVAGATAALTDVVNDVTYDAAAVPRDSVRLLNALGVRPRLFEAERPSGHDLHYSGEDGAFARLARLNAAALRATGARRAVFSCPETMHAYRDLYPRVLGEPLGMECVHLVTLIDGAVNGGTVAFRAPVKGEPPVAYHDSCRMGRALGLYEEPRRALAAAGARLVEMEHGRAYAECCGVGAWQRCDPTSRQLRLARLGEARAAGAAVLVSPCARCTTHFICQLCHDGAAPPPQSGDTKIVDLATFLASRLV